MKKLISILVLFFSLISSTCFSMTDQQFKDFDLAMQARVREFNPEGRSIYKRLKNSKGMHNAYEVFLFRKSTERYGELLIKTMSYGIVEALQKDYTKDTIESVVKLMEEGRDPRWMRPTAVSKMYEGLIETNKALAMLMFQEMQNEESKEELKE